MGYRPTWFEAIQRDENGMQHACYAFEGAFESKKKNGSGTCGTIAEPVVNTFTLFPERKIPIFILIRLLKNNRTNLLRFHHSL